jgi:hypothetical protein
MLKMMFMLIASLVAENAGVLATQVVLALVVVVVSVDVMELVSTFVKKVVI